MKYGKALALFALLSSGSQAIYANEHELKDILTAYVEGKVEKVDVLFHIKKTNFPKDVRDIEVVTSKQGEKSVRWHFSLTTNTVMKENELLKIVGRFKTN